MIPVLGMIESGEGVAVVAVISGCALALAIVAFVTIRASLRDRERERSRREIAAYVAEGSISPADAARLLEAGLAQDGDGQAKKL